MKLFIINTKRYTTKIYKLEKKKLYFCVSMKSRNEVYDAESKFLATQQQLPSPK